MLYRDNDVQKIRVDIPLSVPWPCPTSPKPKPWTSPATRASSRSIPSAVSPSSPRATSSPWLRP